MKDDKQRRQEGKADLPGPTLRGLPLASAGGTAQLLTDHQREQLLRIAVHEEVCARAIIYRARAAATDVFICHEGVLKSFREMRSGARRITAFLFPSDLFGLADQHGYLNTIQAITAASVYRISRTVLVDLLRRDAELEFKFVCKLTHELRVAQRSALTVGRRDAIGRVATFVTTLQQHLSLQAKPGHISLPMKRSEIADYLALSPEAVSRATRRLVWSGVLAFDGRSMVHVVDQNRLDEIVANS